MFDVSLADNFPEALAAITGLFVAIGGAFKWVLNRMDKHDQEERDRQDDERRKLETQFNRQIAALEQHVQAQEQEVARLRMSLEEYVRQVGVLEGLLRAHDIDVPQMPRRHHV